MEQQDWQSASCCCADAYDGTHQCSTMRLVQLTGTVPAWGTDGGLAAVQWVDLSENQLHGSLPQTLKRWAVTSSSLPATAEAQNCMPSNRLM